MNKSIKSFILFLAVITLFISCSESEDLPEVLTIQEKVELLESSEWLLKDFEDSVMYTFSQGERFTFYGVDSVFGDAIPGTNDYSITGDFFTIDYNFGNISTYDLVVSCNNNIVELKSLNPIKKTNELPIGYGLIEVGHQ